MLSGIIFDFKMSKKLNLIISGVNIVEGGTLSIFKNAIISSVNQLSQDFDITVLVNDKNIIGIPGVNYIEFPDIKKSWISRLKFEWFDCKKLSRDLHSDIWLSIHDITPNVLSKIQAVYCHNPSPFYKLSLNDAKFDIKFFLFILFYKYLYKINIKRNNYIFVQQEWIRKLFLKMYGNLPIVVAHPSYDSKLKIISKRHASNEIIFFYPAFPRVFKNFEVLCEAAILLPIYISNKIKIRLTLDGTENSYANYIYNKYSHLKCLQFIGIQNSEMMVKEYSNCDVVVFPSKLETWGLPITEAKSLDKPIIVSKLDYSKETVGEYEKVIFLDPTDINSWSDAIKSFVSHTQTYHGSLGITPDSPYTQDWPAFWHLLTKDLIVN